MPTFKSPFFASYNTRDFNASAVLDQKFTNCIFRRVVNPASNSATWYTEKRPGLDSALTISAGQVGGSIFSSPTLGDVGGSFNSPAYIVAFGNVPSTVWYRSTALGTVNCGSPGDQCSAFTEMLLGGITYFLFSDKVLGTGWYLASDAMSTLAYTADGNNSVNITDIKIAGVNNTAGLYAGQKLTAGANIVAGTRIVSVNAAAFTAVLDTATTGGAFNDLAITKEPIAKQNDADFPTILAPASLATTSLGHFFAEMDGYIFTVTSTSKIYNSDLNSISSWTASNFITANIYASTPTGIFKHHNHIVIFKKGGIEFFYNAGNPTGSILSSRPELASRIGCPYEGCIVQAGNTIYWIGPDRCLWRLNGYTPEKVVAEGNTLGNTNTSGPNISFRFMEAFYLYGQLVIQVAGSNNNYDRWYFPEINAWSQPLFPSLMHFSNDFGLPLATGSSIFSGSITGKSYMLGGASTVAFTDDGTAYTMSMQFAIDCGTQKQKTSLELRVICDVQAGGVLALSFSDNDGATFSTPVNIPLDSYALMRVGPDLLGSWYGKRIFKFEHSSNAPWRGSEWELDYKVAG